MCKDKDCKYFKNEIRITREEYDKLLSDQRMLEILQVFGVDNWEGYDHALREFFAGDGA